MANKMQSKFTLVNDQHLIGFVLENQRLIEHSVRPTMSESVMARLWNEIARKFNAKQPMQRAFSASELQSRWEILLHLIRTKESILKTLAFPGKMCSLIHRTIDELKKCENSLIQKPPSQQMYNLSVPKMSASVKTATINSAPVKTVPITPPLVRSVPMKTVTVNAALINRAHVKPVPVVQMSSMPPKPGNRLQQMFRSNMAMLSKLPHATQVAAVSEIIELLLNEELSSLPNLIHPELDETMQECDNFFQKINLPEINLPTHNNNTDTGERHESSLCVLSENGVVVKDVALHPSSLGPFLITNVQSIHESALLATEGNETAEIADSNLGVKSLTNETPAPGMLITEVRSLMRAADHLKTTNLPHSGSGVKSSSGESMAANRIMSTDRPPPTNAIVAHSPKKIVENRPPFSIRSDSIVYPASIQKRTFSTTAPVEEDISNISDGQAVVPIELQPASRSLPSIERPQLTGNPKNMPSRQTLLPLRPIVARVKAVKKNVVSMPQKDLTIVGILKEPDVPIPQRYLRSYEKRAKNGDVSATVAVKRSLGIDKQNQNVRCREFTIRLKRLTKDSKNFPQNLGYQAKREKLV